MPGKIEDFLGRETDKIPLEFCGPENPKDFLGIVKQFSPALCKIKTK